MKTIIIGAGSDLGVHIDGAHLGPIQLVNDMKGFFQGETVSLIQEEGIIKSRNLSDRRKNEYEIDRFNEMLYHTVLEKMKEGYFPIILGGDHSVAIASSLADKKVNEKVGLLWFDAHCDYNTFETTVTGNIHGLACAAVNGYKCDELREFHDGGTIDPYKTVIVGARVIEPGEKENIKYSGATVFSTDDLKKNGMREMVDKAFEIASTRTKSVHVSFDMDLLDPTIAPGVSIPEVDGINEEEAMELMDAILEHIDQISSFDLVEFNPLRDINRQTEQITVNMLARIVKKVESDKNVIMKY